MLSYLVVRRRSAVAIGALLRNRLKSLLTVVGISIGVATVLTAIALASGAQESIWQQTRAAGMNVLVVTAGNYKMEQQWTSDGETEEQNASAVPTRSPRLLDASWRFAQVRPELLDSMQEARNPAVHSKETDPENLAGLGASDLLSGDDAKALMKIPGVQYVAAGVAENARVEVDGKSWFTRLHGEDSSLPAIRRAWVFRHGRFFNERDVLESHNVAVLGTVLSRMLFGDTDPVGRSVAIKGRGYRVVGEIASGSWMIPEAEGDQQFDAVYIPVTSAQRLLQRSSLTGITVSTQSAGAVNQVANAVTALLRRRHGLSQTEPNDFVVASEAHRTLARGGLRTDVARAVVGNVSNLDKVTLDQLAKTLDRASRTMTALLVSIAGVSLVVGGIGIMNIMLLSVTERTPEIGIRRAVGARSVDVMWQFLLEAVLLSCIGGVLGVMVGIIAATSVAHLIGWSANLSAWSVALSVCIAGITGILFGYYPARQASRVTPIKALRYE